MTLLPRRRPLRRRPRRHLLRRRLPLRPLPRPPPRRPKPPPRRLPLLRPTPARRLPPRLFVTLIVVLETSLLTTYRLPRLRKRSLSSLLRPRPAVSSNLPSLRRPRRLPRLRRPPPPRRLLRRNKLLHLAASSTSCHHRRLQQTLGRRLQGAQMACMCGCDTNLDPSALRRAH